MLIGHKRIWEHLVKSARQEKLAHAYLFLGPQGLGKKALAMGFAQWLLCENKKQAPCGQCRSCLDIAGQRHPDVVLLEAKEEEKDGVVKILEIGIDQIRDVQHRLGLRPYYSSYKIAIVDEIGNLTREAANSFLKTLEEPKGNCLIFLTGSSWQWLLPTVISRCRVVNFSPVPHKDIFEALEKEYSQKALAEAVKISAGRPGRALELLKDPRVAQEQQENVRLLENIFKADLPQRFEIARELSQDIGQAQRAISQWLFLLRDCLLKNYGCAENSVKVPPQADLPDLIREMQKTRALLGNSSFNSRLALEVLMIKI